MKLKLYTGLTAGVMVLLSSSFSAHAELKSLFNNSGDGNSLLNNMLNNGGGTEGGDALSGMLGGMGKSAQSNASDGDSGSGMVLMSVVQDMVESADNTNLGPVGRFALGRNLSARIVGGAKIVPPSDPRITYIRNVAITIMQSSHYGANYVDPIVILIDDPELINAFAAPGGFVFVTTGMLNFLKNEDELAFVLAHEIAHIEFDHGLSAIKQNEGSKLFSKGTKAMGMEEAGEMFGGFLDFAENGYSQDLEAEADMRGAELASALGYDVKAGMDVIRRLEKISDRKHATGYPEDRTRLLESAGHNHSKNPERVSLREKRYVSETRK